MTVRGFLISLGVAVAIAVFGNIPLMGLPGALVWGVFAPLADLILGAGTSARIKGDAMWPLAIVTTLLWPLSIPAGYLLAWGLLPQAALGVRAAVLAGVMALWGLALSVYFTATAPKV